MDQRKFSAHTRMSVGALHAVDDQRVVLGAHAQSKLTGGLATLQDCVPCVKSNMS